MVSITYLRKLPQTEGGTLPTKRWLEDHTHGLFSRSKLALGLFIGVLHYFFGVCVSVSNGTDLGGGGRIEVIVAVTEMVAYQGHRGQ